MDELRTDDPRWIGGYRLLGRLGTGGMGRVYLARSGRGRTVAVKLVRAELAAQEEFRSRFRREVRAARRVGGKWTAPVLDADTEAEIPWVATGYVPGPSLSQVVGKEHGPLPERSVRVLASGLAHALADIHAAGLVHRDLKPSNVMITIDGPRVIDFGIARALETVTDSSITHTGAMVGSPAFMSPEQVRGDRVTPACDIFCLGSVLAYAATGLQPFGAASSGVHAQMFRIVQEPPDLHAVPDGLRGLVAACLAKDPGARPSLERVQEMLTALAPPEGDGPSVPSGLSGDYVDEPWLPGAIVARLGRHAVRLLELEAAETGSIPVVTGPPAPGGEETAGTGGTGTPAPGPANTGSAGTGSAGTGTPAPGAEPPTVPAPQPTAVTLPTTPPPAPTLTSTSAPNPAPVAAPVPAPGPPSYGPAPVPFGNAPAAPKRRGPLLVLAAALVVIAAGTTAAVLVRGHHGGGTGSAADARPPRSPTATSSGAATTTASGIPAAMVGTWETSFASSLGDNARKLTIHQDGTVELNGDSPSYTCVWTMRVTSSGPPVALSASKVVSGSPAGSCNPGPPTTLTLVDPTHLRRDNLDGGRAPLTYEKTG
ncbi:serine/threonine-protein kinase [Streptomyces sp. HPF1205]|uniref:serine/threonine-protein kinase n=1 Tax=Streptomyces sp. HPF1205 TaxID=2873262 RepID=UPI001CEC1C36|nr:serine/threonine-protein kinase [Streptomyces sp. HPF1205]